MDGAELIADERQRQVDAEGWQAEHDDRHVTGELRDAAISYLQACDDVWPHDLLPDPWPWDEVWWKPTYDDPIRMLVKAGALIAAEIDRLQRRQQRFGVA